MTAWTAGNKQSIEAQLQRMKRSAAFEHAGRMYPLLEYLVTAELEDEGSRLSQHCIAVDVFGRDETFDSQTDSIVRVEIGRLRNKLREYYSTADADAEVLIELPKGRYRPVVTIRAVRRQQPTPPLPPQAVEFCKTHDDVMIAYASMGDGPPLVKTSTWLTHVELDYESSIWRHYWSELSRNRTLIRYDSRNMGLSDRNVERFDFDDLVVDLEAVVDAQDLEQFALFGTSQGATIAVAYAARHPERVTHLILLGGMLRGPRRTGDQKAAMFADAMHAALRVGWQQPHSEFRRMLCRTLLPTGTPEHYRLLDELQIACCDADTVVRHGELIHYMDVTAEATKVKAPTLVCHAKHETIPFAEARLMSSRIPNSKLVALDSRNHLLLAHEPAWARFVEEVNEFLATDHMRQSGARENSRAGT